MADHAGVDNNNKDKDKDVDAVFRTPSELSQAEYDDLLDQIRSSSGDNDDEDAVSLTELHDELMEAARYNDVDVVRAILCVHSTAMVYRQRPHQDGGNTALHMAAANGHVEIIELLLLAAAQPEKSRGNTPSSSPPPSPPLLRWHLIPNAAGNTALHWAAANGQTDVVKRLLKEPGVEVLLKNNAGRSILTEAFSSNVEQVIAAILEHDTATEERLVDNGTGSNNTGSGSGKTDQDDDSDESASAQCSVTHKFRFGQQLVLARELAIPSSSSSDTTGHDCNNNGKKDNLSIIGQAASTDDLTGYAIWASSLVMADWLGRLGAAVFRDRTVLELGAGCGVPSLVAASFRSANMVYGTDWNATVLDNLQFNVELNAKSLSSDPGQQPFSPMLVHTMNWQVPSSWPISQVDILLGSDLIYQDDMVDTLLSTVTALRPQRFLYVAGTHRQGHDRFIDALKGCYDCTESPAPTLANPLVEQDDEFCFIHFNELHSMQFLLYDFVQKACEQ